MFQNLHSIIAKGVIIEYTWPAKAHNFTWCKLCHEKGQIIRFQLVEEFRILHANSFFHWRKQTLRKLSKKFKCFYCEECFSSNDERRYHRQQYHPDKKLDYPTPEDFENRLER